MNPIHARQENDEKVCCVSVARYREFHAMEEAICACVLEGYTQMDNRNNPVLRDPRAWMGSRPRVDNHDTPVFGVSPESVVSTSRVDNENNTMFGD